METTANQANGLGAVGNGLVGQSSANAFVNVVNGNVVTQYNDEVLAGTGAELNLLRTYNSLGQSIGNNDARWR